MEENPPELLMVYTTKNGRTGSMVDPIERGIIEAGGTVATRQVDEVRWEEMLAAKEIIVGTPVRFGDVDWEIKRLFDVTAFQDYPGPLHGKVGGAFVGGGRPGSGAELCLLSMLHILLNHGMVIQGTPCRLTTARWSSETPTKRKWNRCATHGDATGPN
jgi:multimeric flavodoxin WrbA